jgi:molybdate/tungstate transport system substrate-binding protein
MPFELTASRMRLLAVVLLAGCAGSSTGGAKQAPVPKSDSLVIYHAGSLTAALAEVAAKFELDHPGVKVRRESGGSVQMARRAMDPADVPDVVALADYAIIPRLLVPAHASWYAAFARNAMALIYTDRSALAQDLTAENWPDILLRPGIRGGHSDPALDPAGYRSRLIFKLAELHYRRPGLADSLDRALPILSAPTGRTILDELRSGELDYLFAYRSTASPGLRVLRLPPEIDLSVPDLAPVYARASIRVAQVPGSSDSLTIVGEPILYGVTVPSQARHRELGEQFVVDLLSSAGGAALSHAGLLPLERPILHGQVPARVR